MNAKLNKQQSDYAIAKAAYEVACEAENEAEYAFILRRGITNLDGTIPRSTFSIVGISDEEFERLTEQLAEDETMKRAFAAKNDALGAKIRAENALIDFGLSIVPPGPRDILNAHRNDYKTREKLIELAFRLDASTIPN